MAGTTKPSLPTNCASAAAITARNLEIADTPFTDVPGDGTFADPYLGVNRAGSNAPGIGINTGEVFQTAAELAADVRFEAWTELDQGAHPDYTAAARTPQESGHIGHINDATTAGTPNDFTPSTVPVTFTTGADVNNIANLVVTDTAAVDDADMDVGGTGSLNRTGGTVGIGDLIWGEEAVT